MRSLSKFVMQPLALAGLLAVPVLAPMSAQAAGLVKTTTVSYTYDAYGNATEVTQTVSDGTAVFTSQTVSTVSNDEATWLLGRPSQTTVTNTKSDGSFLSRTSAMTWQGDTFLPASTTVEPGDAQLEVVTSYSYDSFGNATSTTVSAAGQTARSSSTGLVGGWPLCAERGQCAEPYGHGGGGQPLWRTSHLD
ncbi:hypothetical protein [Kiloniella laminariae]|uniref:hypothetical protein n=1 Tax=Kiloniella laminariae TaxID=454162 RepID=UPI00146E4E8E|nr:hypothetical protein [Kiloniella laminariae]